MSIIKATIIKASMPFILKEIILKNENREYRHDSDQQPHVHTPSVLIEIMKSAENGENAETPLVAVVFIPLPR
jgi:hypothetical protein